MVRNPDDRPEITAATRQLALLVDSVRDYAIFVLDPAGHVLTWNAGAERIKGYRPEEIIGEHFSRFYTQPDLDRRHPEEELRIAKAEGRYEEEGWRVRRDGTRFWANVVITALWEDGELVGFGKVTRDLTERRAAEQALERFRRLVSGVTDYAIFLLDGTGHVATWNAGAERIKGYTAEEIVGEHFSRFYTQADKDREHPQDELRIAAAEGKYEEEGWRVRKDGTRFWANVLITALYGEHGELEGFAKVTRDLTERRAAAESLQTAHAELEQANEELRIFSSAAAHDLREPLRTVQGFGELLVRRHADELSPQARRLLDQMIGNVGRMQELIDALLAFARSGVRELVVETVAVRPAVRRVVAGLTAAVDDRHADVVDDVPEGAEVRADRAMLEVVLQNLLENALKFAGEDAPRVRITGERRDGAWRVSVSDNGIGIAPKDQAVVFEPFRRLHGRLEYGGSGLGLATCRRALERQGGVLGLDSEPGVGSTFWFELPSA
jgi:PAS domain S-box-containing protein